MGLARIPVLIKRINVATDINVELGRQEVVNVILPMLAPSSGMYQNVPDFCNATKGNDVKNGYVPETKENITPKPEPTPEQLDTLFRKLDLTGLNEWPEYEQNEACELIQEYQHLFALDDLELGCTSQVKHKIHLNDEKPFKEHYWRIQRI